MRNTPQDYEMLRKALLKYLVLHHPACFTIQSLCTVIKPRGLIDFDPTPDQAESALALLADLELVRKINDPLGSSEYWSCTGKGVLTYEQGLN